MDILFLIAGSVMLLAVFTVFIIYYRRTPLYNFGEQNRYLPTHLFKRRRRFSGASETKWQKIQGWAQNINYKNAQIIAGVLFILTAFATAKQFWIFQSWGPFWFLVIILVIISRTKTNRGNLKKMFTNVFFTGTFLLSIFFWFIYFC